MTFTRICAIILFFLFTQANLNAQSRNSVWIDSLLNSLRHCLEQHEVNSADSVFAKIPENEITKNNDRQHWEFINLKGDLEGKKNRQFQNLQHKEKALELAEELDDPNLIAESHINLAAYYENLQDYKSSVPHILKSQDIFNDLGRKDRIAYLYNKLGLIHYSDRNYELALEYFFASFVSFNEIKDKTPENAYWIQNNLLNMGLCYDFLNKPQKSLAYYKIALAYCQNAPFGKERPIGVLTSNIGILYGKLKQYKQAFHYLDSGVRICLKPYNQELAHATQTLLYMAKFRSECGEYKTADTLFRLTRSMIETHNFQFLFRVYHYIHSIHLAKQGFYEQAFEENHVYLKIRDSVEKIKNVTYYTKQELIYNLKKEKFANDLLVNQNNYQKLLNLFAFCCTLLAFLGLVWGIVTLKKTKKRNAVLLNLNQQISNQKAELEKLNLALQRTNQNKSFLMSTIAHDLRTPVGNLMSLNELLKDHVEINPESEEYLRLISSSCFLALHIIEDILDQSVIERGILSLRKEKTNVNALIQECVSLLKFRIDPKKIQVITLFEDNLEIAVDADRIKRVVINILMNAIKFSPRNSTIHIYQKLKDHECIISIEDKGIGMDEAMVQKLFNENGVSGKEGLEKERSYGFGLSITKSIIEAHGGKIFVESEPNSGSIFYIHLPLV